MPWGGGGTYFRCSPAALRLPVVEQSPEQRGMRPQLGDPDLGVEDISYQGLLPQTAVGWGE